MTPHPKGRLGRAEPRPAPTRATTATEGLMAGTVVLAGDGEIPVDHLMPGDRIISRDAGILRLDRIDRARCITRAIRIAAGSLGDTRPEEDVILPADQPLLIRDWRAQAIFGRDQALVRAGDLVDGEFITDLGLRKLELYNLRFAARHVIYAGGLELASAAPHAASLRRVA